MRLVCSTLIFISAEETLHIKPASLSWLLLRKANLAWPAAAAQIEILSSSWPRLAHSAKHGAQSCVTSTYSTGSYDAWSRCITHIRLRSTNLLVSLIQFLPEDFNLGVVPFNFGHQIVHEQLLRLSGDLMCVVRYGITYIAQIVHELAVEHSVYVT